MARTANRIEAELELTRWKTLLPRVTSSYRPSGRLSLQSVKSMSAGAVIGALWGVLVGAAVLIPVFVVGIFVRLLYFLSGQGKIALIGLLMWGLVLVGFLLYLALYCAVGYTCASRVLRRADKTRSVLIASLFSMASTLASTFIFVFGCHSIPFAGDLRVVWDIIFSFGDAGWIAVFASGSVIALLVAVWHTFTTIRSRKYCEACDCSMGKKTLRHLQLESLAAFCSSLSTSLSTDIKTVLQRGKAGRDGTVDLFSCPQCGRGFLEVEVTYGALWDVMDGEKRTEQSMAESWLAASRVVSPEETAQLKGIKDKQSQLAD